MIAICAETKERAAHIQKALHISPKHSVLVYRADLIRGCELDGVIWDVDFYDLKLAQALEPALAGSRSPIEVRVIY